ncbi:response regulator transcription factor [Streptomyces sp. NRRL F-5755]|uniref:response regulator transcription factor n=1 Tax=Streptomyces sp. NRRL F-5755 TaxID=1519475 RepID=UPI000ADDC13A|nr:LuxR C-terminal-related transcriptional regulator [Streptomyces sp. NRRL F-5755]
MRLPSEGHLPADLAHAGRTVAEGSAMLMPKVTMRLDEVVRAVARGLANAEIGRELAMSEGTVKAHVSRALAKLGLSNRVQMALLVRDAGKR